MSATPKASDGRVTIPLQVPVTAAGQTVKSLTFQRLKGRHLRQVETPGERDMAMTMELIGILSGQLEEVIDELEGVDLRRAMEYASAEASSSDTQIIENPDGSKTIPLRTAVVLDATDDTPSITVSELKVRKIKGKFMRLVETPSAMSVQMTMELGEILSGQPSEVIDRLDGGDALALLEVISDFLQGTPATGER